MVLKTTSKWVTFPYSSERFDARSLLLQTAVLANLNDVIFTSNRISTDGGGNPVNCSTSNKTTATVLVPKFEFNKENDSPEAHNYIDTGTTLSSGKIEISTSVKITIGLNGFSVGTINSSRGSGDTLTPSSGSTTSGFITTVLKTKDQTLSLKVQIQPQSTIISSDDHNMLPAFYKNTFHVTGYYTPNEDDFSGTSTTSTTLNTGSGSTAKHYNITSSASAKSGFLQAVALEGEGYLHSGTHVTTSNITETGTSNPTIIDSTITTDSNVPKASDGSNLVANTSIAIVRDGSGNGIVIPEAASVNVIGHGNRLATDRVAGNETGGNYHIDLYCGTNKSTADGISEDDNVVLNSY